jgi:hypothetical protein
MSTKQAGAQGFGGYGVASAQISPGGLVTSVLSFKPVRELTVQEPTESLEAGKTASPADIFDNYRFQGPEDDGRITPLQEPSPAELTLPHQNATDQTTGVFRGKYRCEFNCGFRGSFEVVAAHEKTCPLAQAVMPAFEGNG